ncbi:MAG: hypothetical protein ACKPKO_28435, partial [Candidatus Fonsibacter sp.]
PSFKLAPPEASPSARSASVRAASAAAVIHAASGMERFESRVGQEEDKSFDELYDWKLDADGAPYWEKGPETFKEYVGKVFWDRLSMPYETGYLDLGWIRPAPSFIDKPFVDNTGAHHLVGDLHLYVP